MKKWLYLPCNRVDCLKLTKMKKWKIEIILSVDDSWIADGFDASERVEDIQELFCNLLPYAYNHEIIAKAKITLAPDPKVIRSLQGYDIS